MWKLVNKKKWMHQGHLNPIRKKVSSKLRIQVLGNYVIWRHCFSPPLCRPIIFLLSSFQRTMSREHLKSRAIKGTVWLETEVLDWVRQLAHRELSWETCFNWVFMFDEPCNVLCSLQRFGELLIADILQILLSIVGNSRLGKILIFGKTVSCYVWPC